MRRVLPHRFLASAIMLATLACGGDGTGPVAPPPPPPPPPPAPVPRAMFSPPIAGLPMQDYFYGAYRDDGNQDYSCGFKWYGGHKGVDILLRNFQVQDSGVAVLAAAAGTVLQTHDGESDRSTANGAGGFGNYVFIEHGAGDPLAYYGHMRKGSIRVTPGAVIKRGDTLGLVGSSGNSNWPHLHFEVSDAGLVIDPFIGPCNTAASPPTWLAQPPWQGEFAVLDAGISRLPLSWAEILERPADAAVITAADQQVSFWASLYNIQVPSTRTVLLNKAGAVLAEISTADARTFSTVFLVATFNIVGVVTAAGQYSIALSVTTPTGSLLEVARRQFTYDPGGVPSAERAPGPPGQMTHAVRISPSAGDRP